MSDQQVKRYTDGEIDDLAHDADKCHKHCSDYSCVRMGSCTGEAGYQLRNAIHANELAREQDESDRALAEQINRLKNAGAI